MSPVGHTLTGLAIGYLAIPRETPGKQHAVLLAACAVLASAPDLPFPYWGHNCYEISHSLFCMSLGVCLLEIILWRRFRGRQPVTISVMIAMGLAWFSHLLLDSFYNHAIGLRVFWPFGDGRLNLPIPWLSTGDKMHIFSMHNLKVAALEILTFGPLLALAVMKRKYFSRLEHPAASSLTE